jgi:hypothetical protein
VMLAGAFALWMLNRRIPDDPGSSAATA